MRRTKIETGPWSRRLTITALILMSLTTASTGYSQTTTCDAERRCFSRAEVRAVADAACAVDRLNAKRAVELVGELEIADRQIAICEGRLLELRENPPAAPRIAPLWLRLSLDVAIGALGAGTGAAAGVGAPVEVVAVGASLGFAALVGRVVLELIRWK